MNIYRDGSTVQIELPFVDEDGNAISATAASYRVLAEDRTELIGQTIIALSGGETSATITIDATHNTLSATARRALRTIELKLTTTTGIVGTDIRYVIESDATVIAGETSFMTFSEAILTALDMSNLERWELASDRNKKNALIEAYENICKLNFSVVSNLNLMDEVTLDTLDAEFFGALHKAQVAEADYVLGGNSIEDKRRIGLMSETIGESSNMFRPGKPLILPVSERALHYLGKYVSWSVGLGRR